MNLNNCPVCRSTNISKFIELKDYFLSYENFEIWLCDDCGVKFTNPVPRETEISRYYQSDEYISHNSNSKGFVNTVYKIVRNYSVKSKANIATSGMKKGNALDIGCGTGEFLSALKKRGWNVTGIEPNEKARNLSQNKYQIEVGDKDALFQFQEDSFELVTMWHVLEHVFDLDKNLKQIRKILKGNGKLVIALPNAKSVDAKIYGKYWAAYDVPRHLYHFDRSSFSNLIRKYDFELVQVKPMIFDSFYISMLSEKYKTGKIRYPQAVINGLKTDLKGIFDKDAYSSLTYVLRSKEK